MSFSMDLAPAENNALNAGAWTQLVCNALEMIASIITLIMNICKIFPYLAMARMSLLVNQAETLSNPVRNCACCRFKLCTGLIQSFLHLARGWRDLLWVYSDLDKMCIPRPSNTNFIQHQANSFYYKSPYIRAARTSRSLYCGSPFCADNAVAYNISDMRWWWKVLVRRFHLVLVIGAHHKSLENTQFTIA